jgi:GT2 family glycosyltransferase
MSEAATYNQGEPEAAASPVVSVVVLNLDKSKLTLECLASIRRHAGIPCEFIVVDNGSGAADLAVLEQGCARARVRLIRLNQNLFFGEANNIGAEAANGEFVLFINNDVTVTPGCIEALLKSLQNAYRAGAVGPRFVYPDGRLQEAGGYLRSDGWSVQHGKLDRSNALIAGPGLHIVDYCSAACLLAVRDVFLRLGGFDPLFEPAYFEDADLCLRLRSIGLFTYFCGDATVVHEESQTSNSIWTREQLLSVTNESHRKFAERWGDYLSARLQAAAKPPPAAEVNWQPDPQWGGDLPIAYVQDSGLIGDAANWNALLSMAARLERKFHIVFLADEVCSRCRMYLICRRLKIELSRFSIRRAHDVALSDLDTVVSFEHSKDRDFRIAGPMSTEIWRLLGC